MDASELGRRLKIVRSERHLTQQTVANAIGISRTAVTKMETGERSVSTLELAKLATLYNRSVNFFLTESEQVDDEDPLVELYLAEPGLEKDQSVRTQVTHCLDLCREGTVLRRMLGLISNSVFPMYRLPVPDTEDEAIEQGESIARDQRHRLNLGFSPIPDVSGLIRAQGIWVSSIALPKRISGVFMCHSSLGPTILVNAAKPLGWKRFSYAHEYAHALLDRVERPSISSTDNSAQLVEKRANAFAAGFLMPNEGVREVLGSLGKIHPRPGQKTLIDAASAEAIEIKSRFNSRIQKITHKDVALIAHHYGINYRVILYRLKSLQCVSQPEFEDLSKKAKYGNQFLKLLKMSDRGERRGPGGFQGQNLRIEVASLAIDAYRREKISRGRLLELSGKIGVPGEEFLELAEMAR